MIHAFSHGFFSGASLIIAIGSQNAFVLKQGLQKKHLLLCALVCSLIDSVLITVGVLGFGHIVSLHPFALDCTKNLGALFLFCYGALSFKAAYKGKSHMEVAANKTPQTTTKTVLLLLAFGLLNPHVYLDTVFLLGSIAASSAEEKKVLFSLGAIVASFTWFFSLTYGAKALCPLFKKKWSWMAIEVFVGITMWLLSYNLIFNC